MQYIQTCVYNPSDLERKVQCDQTSSLTLYCNSKIFSILMRWSDGGVIVTAKTLATQHNQSADI